MTTYTQVPNPAGWVAFPGGTNQAFDARFDSDGTTFWVFQQLGNGFARYNISGLSLVYSGSFFGNTSSHDILQHDEGIMLWDQDDAGHYFVTNGTNIYKFHIGTSAGGDVLDTHSVTDATLALSALSPAVDIGTGTLQTQNTEVFKVCKSGGVNYLLIVGTVTISTLHNAVMWVINADTMTFVGSYVDAPVTNGKFGYEGWVDNAGDIWMFAEVGADGSFDFVQWHPANGATGGTLNGVTVHNVTTTTMGFGSPAFAAYDPDNSKIIAAGYGTGTGLNLAVIDSSTFTRTALRADDGTVGYSNWLDGTLSSFAYNCRSSVTAFGLNGDTNPNGSFQGGLLKILDKTSLAINNTTDIASGINASGGGVLWGSTVDTNPGYGGAWVYNPATGNMLAGFSNQAVSSSVYLVTGLPTYSAGNPTISLSKTSLSYSGEEGASVPSQNVGVANAGTGTLSYTTSSDAAWLTCTPASGTAPGTLVVSVNLSGRAPNTYTGHITVSAAGATNTPQTITVTLTVTAPATLSLTGATTIQLAGVVGGVNPPVMALSASNSTNSDVMTVSPSSDASWLTTSAAITAPGTLRLTTNIAGLAAGSYTGHVTVAASNVTVPSAPVQGSPATVTVNLTIYACAPSLTLNNYNFWLKTNGDFTNIVQLSCDPLKGPLNQVGPLGAFDPTRDLTVYIDGVPTKVNTFNFSPCSNRYVLHMASQFSAKSVVQVVHHLPSPPFRDQSGSPLTVRGFAIGYRPTVASLGVLPTSTLPNMPVTLYYETQGVGQIRIKDSGTAYDSGMIDVSAYPDGFLEVAGGFASTITLTMYCYDNSGNPVQIKGVALTASTTITIV